MLKVGSRVCRGENQRKYGLLCDGECREGGMLRKEGLVLGEVVAELELVHKWLLGRIGRLHGETFWSRK